MGARKHIWRGSCGPRVFGNSLRSAASVDFIILIARHENISKAHISILQKREEEEKGGGGGDAQESDPKTATPQQMANSPTLTRYLGTDVCECGH